MLHTLSALQESLDAQFSCCLRTSWSGQETYFILVSCTGSGIDPTRREQVLKAKKAGEDSVRRSGPGYTIIRPGLLKSLVDSELLYLIKETGFLRSEQFNLFIELFQLEQDVFTSSCLIHCDLVNCETVWMLCVVVLIVQEMSILCVVVSIVA